MNGMIPAILVVAAGEIAWALFCAETGVNLLVFYVVLVAVSALFWLPDRAESRSASHHAPSTR